MTDNRNTQGANSGGSIIPQSNSAISRGAFSDDLDAARATTTVQVEPTGSAAVFSQQSPHKLILRTLQYKWTIAAIFLLIASGAIPVIWKIVKPEYKAAATLQIKPVVNPILFKSDVTGEVPQYTSYVNTQVGLIGSPVIAERALNNPLVKATAWYQNLPKEGPSPTRTLRSGLRVSNRPKTELIDVAFTCENANDAAIIVRAVVGEYFKYHNRDQAEADSKRTKALLDEKSTLETQIRTLEQSTLASRPESLLGNPDEVLTQLGARKVALETHLDAIQIQQVGLQVEREVIEKQLERAGVDVNDKENEEETAENVSTENASSADDTSVDVNNADSKLAQGETPPAAAIEGSGTAASEVPVTRDMIERDREWRRLKDLLDGAEHNLRLAKARYGESHPRIRDLKATVEHQQTLLDTYEESLTEMLAKGEEPVPAEPGQPVRLNPLAELDQNSIELSKAVAQGQVISNKIKGISKDAQEALQVREESQELNRRRERLEKINERLDILEMEKKAAGRVLWVGKEDGNDNTGVTSSNRPVKDKRLLFTAMVICAAFGFGFGVAFLRAALNSSIQEASEVTATISAPFLGQLPRTKRESLLDADDGLLQESLRMVRTALIERVAQSGTGVSVLITSPTSQTGKTTLSIMLAHTLGQMGKKILLIDGDLRRSSLTSRLGHEGEPGLTTVLQGQATWQQIVLSTSVPCVDLLPVGAFHGKEDLERLAGQQLAHCLTECKNEYDFVIVDSPPVLPVADARILTRLVDGTILTIRASHSRRTDAVETMNRLRAAGGDLIGTVLIGSDKRSRYYGYNNDYGYYYYGSKPKHLT